MRVYGFVFDVLEYCFLWLVVVVGLLRKPTNKAVPEDGRESSEEDGVWLMNAREMLLRVLIREKVAG